MQEKWHISNFGGKGGVEYEPARNLKECLCLSKGV